MMKKNVFVPYELSAGIAVLLGIITLILGYPVATIPLFLFAVGCLIIPQALVMAFIIICTGSEIE